MTPFVIGITGVARSGKDTVAKILTNTHPEFVHINFADTLRELAVAVNPVVDWNMDGGPLYYNEAIERYGYERAKDSKPELRRFLQRMGTEGGRQVLKETIWTDKWFEKATAAIEQGKSVVTSDVRFLNEAQVIKGLSPVAETRIWRVYRSGLGETMNHASETELNKIEFDQAFSNDSTIDALTTKVQIEFGIQSHYA